MVCWGVWYVVCVVRLVCVVHAYRGLEAERFVNDWYIVIHCLRDADHRHAQLPSSRLLCDERRPAHGAITADYVHWTRRWRWWSVVMVVECGGGGGGGGGDGGGVWRGALHA